MAEGPYLPPGVNKSKASAGAGHGGITELPAPALLEPPAGHSRSPRARPRVRMSMGGHDQGLRCQYARCLAVLDRSGGAVAGPSGGGLNTASRGDSRRPISFIIL